MESRECVSNDLRGQCMFAIECMQHKGRAIGICVERYYVGSCCHFNLTNELKNPNDRLPSESAVQQANNSLKLRMVNKPNITAFIKNQVNKLFSDPAAVRRPSNEPEKISGSPVNPTSTSSSPPTHDTPAAQISNEEVDSANFINFTGLIDPSIKLPIKPNYPEQTKPANLIGHQTTISRPDRINSLSTESDALASSSGLPLVEQSTSPMSFNNSQADRLIDYQTTTEPAAPNAINFINSSAVSLPAESAVEKYLRNQGWNLRYFLWKLLFLCVNKPLFLLPRMRYAADQKTDRKGGRWTQLTEKRISVDGKR